MLKGVEYIFERIGPMTELWGMPQERGKGGYVKPEATTEKKQDVSKF